MTPKSFKLIIAFKVTPQVKNKAQTMTMELTFGLTLKAVINCNDFGVIRLSSFYSINVLNFMQKNSRKGLFSEFFGKTNKFKMAKNVDFFTCNPLNDLRFA